MTRWVKGPDGKLLEVTHEFDMATNEIRPVVSDDSTPPKGTVFGTMWLRPNSPLDESGR